MTGLAKRRRTQKLRRVRLTPVWREARICLNCGCESAVEGRLNGAKCLARAKIASVKRSQKLRKNGLCKDCGKWSGKTIRCISCAARNAAASRVRRATKAAIKGVEAL